MPQKVNASDLNEGFLPLPTGPVHQLNDHDITWYITDTLTLNIEIGEWRLSESKVMEALEAANAAIGKKVGSSPLDEPFIQKTGGRINTMLFEIRSESTDQSLTWAQVGEVLGANGLPSYFRAYDIWRSTFFDVVDSERGKIGHGALRKWYMVESPRQGNLTMSASGDIIPA